jgi:hypothetical protein
VLLCKSKGVKKPTSHVIPSEARNLQLFVFKCRCLASLSMTARTCRQKSTEQSENVYENKGQGKKVEQPGSADLQVRNADASLRSA